MYLYEYNDDSKLSILHCTGLAHGAEQAPMYNLLTAVIGGGCKAAIFLSERI